AFGAVTSLRADVPGRWAKPAIKPERALRAPFAVARGSTGAAEEITAISELDGTALPPPRASRGVDDRRRRLNRKIGSPQIRCARQQCRYRNRGDEQLPLRCDVTVHDRPPSLTTVILGGRGFWKMTNLLLRRLEIQIRAVVAPWQHVAQSIITRVVS